MQKQKNTPQNLENEKETIRLRHNRFDGFDIYTVEMHGRKSVFHKEAMREPLIIGGEFKVLGANGDLWLCENTKTKMIHIGPTQSFENQEIPDQGKQ